MGSVRDHRSGSDKARGKPIRAGGPVTARPAQYGAGPREMLLALQRTAGNRATSALIEQVISEARVGTTRASSPVPHQEAMERFFGESFADTRVATGLSDLRRCGDDR